MQKEESAAMKSKYGRRIRPEFPRQEIPLQQPKIPSPARPKGRPYPDKNLWPKVVAVLSDNPEGLTIAEASKLSGVRRQTVAAYLETLREQGMVSVRPVGRAKLYRRASLVTQ